MRYTCFIVVRGKIFNSQAFILSVLINVDHLLITFTQDPVYGRGKLGEIQSLVLGMLDSFNYEQVSRRWGFFFLLIKIAIVQDLEFVLLCSLSASKSFNQENFSDLKPSN